MCLRRTWLKIQRVVGDCKSSFPNCPLLLGPIPAWRLFLGGSRWSEFKFFNRAADTAPQTKHLMLPKYTTPSKRKRTKGGKTGCFSRGGIFFGKLKNTGYLVDPASSARSSQRLSHACLSINWKYSETANGSLYQKSSTWGIFFNYLGNWGKSWANTCTKALTSREGRIY